MPRRSRSPPRSRRGTARSRPCAARILDCVTDLRCHQQDIQADLFYDYRTNVASYPAWQHWLREHQPPLQVIWGRYDPSLQVEEAEAYRRDVPGAEVRILDAGHFALDEQPDLIADLIRGFLRRHRARADG
jgi:pimeloyl-ACP methyl ester carboxylesterase